MGLRPSAAAAKDDRKNRKGTDEGERGAPFGTPRIPAHESQYFT